MQAQVEAIRAKVQQCIALAESKFGITMPNVQIRFDLRGRAAGMAGMKANYQGGRTFYLRFNIQHIQLGGKTYEHLLNDTVPHEVAHTVCQAFPQFGKNHDAGWKRVCVALGGNGTRCYSENDAPEAVALQRPWVYITTAGKEVRVTKVLHSKIQRGAAYTVRGKGSINNQCQYNYMTAPATRTPVVVNTAPTASAQPVQRTAVPAVAPATASKAEQVRAMLRRGNTPEQVVEWAVAVLGMKAALARTYVKNNIGR